MITEILFTLLGFVIGMIFMAVIVIKQPMLLMSMVSGDFTKDLIQGLGKDETKEAECKDETNK